MALLSELELLIKENEPVEFWGCIDSIPKDGLGPGKNKKDFLTNMPINKVNLSSESRGYKKTISTTTEVKSKIQNSNPTTKKTIKRIPTNVERPFSDVTKAEDNYFKTDHSLVTTPPCPKCKNGHLLPHSQIVKVTTRKKEVLPISKWICSNCGFSPYNNDSE